MSTRIPKLLEIYQEIITEIGDLANIIPLPYRKESENKYSFYISETLESSVDFSDMEEYFDAKLIKLPPAFLIYKTDNIVSLGYSINGDDRQYMRTNSQLLFRILATVLNIAREYLEEHPDTFIGIMESLAYGKDKSQKLVYYLEILKRNLPPNYIQTSFRIEENFFEGVHNEGVLIGPKRKWEPKKKEKYRTY